MLSLLRAAVSGRRNRFRDADAGDDLDLTYITPRLLAMSFPAADLEALYRHRIHDVARMLDRRHRDAYLVLNLSERAYDNALFGHRVVALGFPDHYAPPVEVAWTLCLTMDAWLNASEVAGSSAATRSSSSARLLTMPNLRRISPPTG